MKGESITAQKSLVKAPRSKAAVVNLLELLGDDEIAAKRASHHMAPFKK